MEKSEDSSRFSAYTEMMRSYFQTHPGKHQQEERRRYQIWEERSAPEPQPSSDERLRQDER